MDQYNLGYVLINLIQAEYPGGMMQFTHDGGMIGVVPVEDTCLIYLPELPEKFKERIDLVNETGNLNIQIVTDLNFEDMEGAEINAALNEALVAVREQFSLNCLLINPGRLILMITIPNVSYPMTDLETIAGIILSKVPNIKRGLIICDKEILPFASMHTTTPTVKDIPVIAVEKANRIEAITPDVITDLRILLNQDMDVNDIIKNL
jgi:hypothetical protein